MFTVLLAVCLSDEGVGEKEHEGGRFRKGDVKREREIRNKGEDGVSNT